MEDRVTQEQAQAIIELLKKQTEVLEGVAMELSSWHQWRREAEQYPRQVEVTNRNGSR